MSQQDNLTATKYEIIRRNSNGTVETHLSGVRRRCPTDPSCTQRRSSSYSVQPLQSWNASGVLPDRRASVPVGGPFEYFTGAGDDVSLYKRAFVRLGIRPWPAVTSRLVHDLPFDESIGRNAGRLRGPSRGAPHRGTHLHRPAGWATPSPRQAGDRSPPPRDLRPDHAFRVSAWVLAAQELRTLRTSRPAGLRNLHPSTTPHHQVPPRPHQGQRRHQIGQWKSSNAESDADNASHPGHAVSIMVPISAMSCVDAPGRVYDPSPTIWPTSTEPGRPTALFNAPLPAHGRLGLGRGTGQRAEADYCRVRRRRPPSDGRAFGARPFSALFAATRRPRFRRAMPTADKADWKFRRQGRHHRADPAARASKRALKAARRGIGGRNGRVGR